MLSHQDKSRGANFAYLWRYQVDPKQKNEFLHAYGPDGEWVRLFRRDPAYLCTELLRDADNDHTFITIDYWASRTARDLFRERWSAEFAALDRRCEAYTRNEQLIGDFYLGTANPD